MAIRKLFGYRFSEPPPRIGVFYGDAEIAELSTEGPYFIFRYLPGFSDIDLSPLPGFPDTSKVYRSVRLWPFFQERIPDRRRPEIRDSIEREGLAEASPLELLAKLGARSISDPFEFRLIRAA